MKICPTCRTTYADDGLNFCLDDGSVLTFASSEPATVVMHAAPPTNPAAGITQPPTMQTSWDPAPEYSLQPKKRSSKTWLWVVGVLGLGLLLCGGGIAGLFALALMTDTEDPYANNRRSIDNSRKDETPTPDRSSVQRVELVGWVDTAATYGSIEYTGGEFVMASRQKDYYFVLVARPAYTTEGASTRLTVRNRDARDSNLGFGLVFHSDPTPLEQGYAFLIDSKKQRYRVVRHEKQKEIAVVDWTNSSAIRPGAAPNTLEANHKGDNIEFTINGRSITSIRNVHGYQGGVPGLYSGGGIKIAFKDLEIRR